MYFYPSHFVLDICHNLFGTLHMAWQLQIINVPNRSNENIFKLNGL